MTTASAALPAIIKRDGRHVAYDRDRIATAIFKAAAAVGEGDRNRADSLARAVEQRLVAMYGAGNTPSVEEIQDLVEQTLIHEGYAEIARAYIIYRHERARERSVRHEQAEVSDNIPYKKIYEVLRWNLDHRCATLDEINQWIEKASFPGLVAACDRRYRDEVAAAAAQLTERQPGVRVVIVAGPSSSGKTTTTIKLCQQLAAAGLDIKTINVDNYFFDLHLHPRDDFGDYDYETPEALDLELIDLHIRQLLAGETIRAPHYNFKTGKRTLDVHEMRLAGNQLLLIDSLHGLHDAMTRSIPDTLKFRIYVETLGQVRSGDGSFMRWADNRLMRRMVRDSRERNLAPMGTLTHWHYVRRSELEYIIPFVGHADALINSALPYELPLLKARIFDYFPVGEERYRDDPRRQDAYIRAKRIRQFLEPLHAFDDEEIIPPDSLLREFIGGSCHTY